MSQKINLRYSKETKQFYINENFDIDKLERLIQKAFNIDENIIGFKDDQGTIYELSQLNSLKKPHQKVLKLILSNQTDKLQLGLIHNLEQFENQYIEKLQQCVGVLVFKNHKEFQKNKSVMQYINHIQGQIQFFLYFSENRDIFNGSFLNLYKNGQLLVQLPISSIYQQDILYYISQEKQVFKKVQNFMEKPKNYQSDNTAKIDDNQSLYKLSDNDENQEDIFYKFITKMYSQQFIIEKEYQEIKNKYQETCENLLDQTFQECLSQKNYQKFKIKVQQYLNNKQSQYKQLHRGNNNNQENQNMHVKYLNTVNNIAEKGFLTDPIATALRMLISADNQEIFNCINNYQEGLLNEFQLCEKLENIAQISRFNSRPAAPSAEKVALLNRCESLYREKLINADQYQQLKKFVHEEDQIIYAIFEILKQSQDKYDFLENFNLILNKKNKNQQNIPIQQILNNYKNQFLTGVYGFTCMWLKSKKNEQSIELQQNQENFENLQRIGIECFDMFLKQNFKLEDIQFLKTKINSEDNELYNILKEFDNNQNVSQLINSMQKFIENLKEEKKPTYCSIANSRFNKREKSFIISIENTENQLQKVEKKLKQETLFPTLNQQNNEIDKILMDFYQNQQNFKNQEFPEINVILEKINWSQNQRNQIKELLDLNNLDLLKILNEFKQNQDLIEIRKKIIEILEQNTIQISNSQDEPVIKRKISMFNSFSYHVFQLYDTDKQINKKQYNLFQYLYLEEDITLFSAYELFCVYQEKETFVENLLLIYKLHYFKSNLDMSEIEQFDDQIKKQLCILYGYKKYLNNEQYQCLEKIIRAGDNSIWNMFREFKSEHHNILQFVQEIRQFSDDKKKQIQVIEQQMTNSINKNQEMGNDENKAVIQRIIGMKLLKNINKGQIFFKLIEENDEKMNSILQIYNMNKDKGELIENLLLINQTIQKNKILQLIVKYASEKSWNEDQNAAKQNNSLILGAFDFYNGTSDDQSEELEDFIETMDIFIKSQ